MRASVDFLISVMGHNSFWTCSGLMACWPDLCEFSDVSVLFCLKNTVFLVLSRTPGSYILPSHSSLIAERRDLISFRRLGVSRSLTRKKHVVQWWFIRTVLVPMYYRRTLLWWWPSETLIYRYSRTWWEVILLHDPLAENSNVFGFPLGPVSDSWLPEQCKAWAPFPRP